MKIRHKTTLGIVVTALVAALSLASYIFLEVLEEPIKLIDSELTHVGGAIFAQGASQPAIPWQLDTTILPHDPEGYWIKVSNEHGEILYQSSLVAFGEIPKGPGKHSRYSTKMIIPRGQIDIGQDEEDKVIFRVRVFHRDMNGQALTMRIAKPIEKLEQELITVIKEAIWGVLICVCLLIGVSYYLAGRLLQPVVTMTKLAHRISEDSLDQRIPLGKNNDELTELAKALNRMFDGLQYSFDRQRAFISNGSHELKSPLTRLLLRQEELLQNPNLPEDIRGDLDRQLTTMQQMKKLVQNLLSLSRLEQQDTLTLEKFDLRQLIDEIVDNYQEMLSVIQINLTLTVQDEMEIEGDKIKLRQLFVNLVDNGLRYNDPENGTLTITANATDEHYIIEIDNAGLEIPLAEQKHVFEQFYRVEKSRASIHGGVGLGLTISQKIVELHGGKIHVAPSKLGGTMFRVMLPRIQHNS
jgi:signal transduction histidine kinase